MNIRMDPSVGSAYKSRSQKARVITEDWVEEELYCPSCPSQSLESLPASTRVADFRCPECFERFQAKSSSKPIYDKVLDSAYETMMIAIKTDSAPNLVLIHYSPIEWTVENLVLIPRFFVVPSAIEKRKPLSPTARRAGWVGCNILLHHIPDSGRINAVKDRVAREPTLVKDQWKRTVFAKDIVPESRGWTIEVLRFVESLHRDRFTLEEMYQFEGDLSELHPQNRNIKAKIRQQLQVLRDKGILRFDTPGVYEILKRFPRF